MRRCNRTLCIQAGTVITGLALLTACTGGGSDAAGGTGTVNVLMTDAPTDAWSQIGIIVRKVALVPQGGDPHTAGVVVFEGSAETQPLNLVHLDELSELLNHRVS